MKKKIAMVVALCCCVIGTSACAEAVVGGQNAVDHTEQASKVNGVAETIQVTEKTPSCQTPPKILVWSKKFIT